MTNECSGDRQMLALNPSSLPFAMSLRLCLPNRASLSCLSAMGTIWHLDKLARKGDRHKFVADHALHLVHFL